MPVALWDLLPNKYAYSFVGFVTSPNLVRGILEPSDWAIIDTTDFASTNLPQHQLKTPRAMNSSPSDVDNGIGSNIQGSLATERISDQAVLSLQDDNGAPKMSQKADDPPIPSTAANVAEMYLAVKSNIGLYTELRDTPKQYRVIRTGFCIENYRLELWTANLGIEDLQRPKGTTDKRRLAIVRLFELILGRILNAFQEAHGKLHTPAGRLVKSIDELIMQLISPIGSNLTGVQYAADENQPKAEKIKAVQQISWTSREKGRMKSLIMQLHHFNDKLEHMSSQLEEASFASQVKNVLHN